MTDVSAYGPWAVIAGGSEGVGAELAKLLAAEGINLVLVARKPGPLEVTAQVCGQAGVQVRTVCADLTDPATVGEVVSATDDVEVGLLIYNAGSNTCSQEFLDGDLGEFRRVIELNMSAMLALVHTYGRSMRERQRGAMMIVGSMAGYLGAARHTVYGGVKAFSRIFAEGLWLELREYNVHVVEVVLGVTRTPAMQRVGLNFDIPGMRVADPRDVAREALANITNGPVYVAGGNGADVERRNHPDRASAVLSAHHVMQKLVGRG